MNLTDLKENLNTFSWAQMTSNPDGKTSATGAMGIVVTMAGVFGFLAGIVDFSIGTGKPDIMMYSGGVITVGTGMLVGRKYKNNKSVAEEAQTISTLQGSQP